MNFCLAPTQQLTLLPPTYIQVGFPHTECQVYCYSSFTQIQEKGKGFVTILSLGSTRSFLSPGLSWDSCSLLWACLNFLGHRRTLKSTCFQWFLIWEIFLICLTHTYMPSYLLLHLCCRLRKKQTLWLPKAKFWWSSWHLAALLPCSRSTERLQ